MPPPSIVAIVVLAASVLVTPTRADIRKSWVRVRPARENSDLFRQLDVSVAATADAEQTKEASTEPLPRTEEQHQTRVAKAEKESLELVEGVTVRVDEPSSTVSMSFNESSVRAALDGRGKKHNYIERIVPLFILPWLIQSAIIPFIVSTIKLLLMKSLFVGKTAILLFLLGAFRNFAKANQRNHNMPYYLKDAHDFSGGASERITDEFVDGYRFDGRPTALIHH